MTILDGEGGILNHYYFKTTTTAPTTTWRGWFFMCPANEEAIQDFGVITALNPRVCVCVWKREIENEVFPSSINAHTHTHIQNLPLLSCLVIFFFSNGQWYAWEHFVASKNWREGELLCSCFHSATGSKMILSLSLSHTHAHTHTHTHTLSLSNTYTKAIPFPSSLSLLWSFLTQTNLV